MTLTYASCTSPAHSYRSECRARWSAWASLNHGAAAAADYNVSFEVRCRRSRWIAGWLPVGEVITGCRSWCRTSSAIRLHWTQKCAEITLKTASFPVLVDPPPNWVLCGDAGLAGRCYATCSIASPSLGQCTGIQDRLGTAPGAGHLATPQRTAFEWCICFQNHFIKQKRSTLFTATSRLSGHNTAREFNLTDSPKQSYQHQSAPHSAEEAGTFAFTSLWVFMTWCSAEATATVTFTFNLVWEF